MKKLGRRLLLDCVDAVRKAAAEHMVMAARTDLDRCPHRPRHHVPGAACYGRAGRLPSLSLPHYPPASPLPAVRLGLNLQPALSQDCVSPRPPAEQERGELFVGDEGGDEGGVSAEGIVVLEESMLGAGGRGSAMWGAGEEGGGAGGGRGESEGGGAEGEEGCGSSQDDGDRSDVCGELMAAETEASSTAMPETPMSVETIGSGHPEAGVRDDGGIGLDGDEAGGTGGVAPEPRDRVAACGLWLLLVVMPLMQECLEGSHRGRLVALHMTQVRGGWSGVVVRGMGGWITRIGRTTFGALAAEGCEVPFPLTPLDAYGRGSGGVGVTHSESAPCRLRPLTLESITHQY